MKRPNSERWYDIPDYRGQYQISNRGRVRSLNRIDASGHRRSMRLLRGNNRPNGRRFFSLCKNSTSRHFCASMLMAQAYGIPNLCRCKYVVHRNHDNSDFRRGNLTWVNLAEQRMRDGVKLSCRYYGVTCNQHRGNVLRWVAHYRVADKRRDIGYFATPEEAAYAYDREIKRLGLNRPLNDISRPRAYAPTIESLPGEVWRPFPDAQRTHAISNFGRVRTLPYVNAHGERVLPKLRKITVNRSGGRSVVIGRRRYTIGTILSQVFGR